MYIPIEEINNRLTRIEELLEILLNGGKQLVDKYPLDEDLLTSIKEIASFLRIGITKAQNLKNQHSHIFIQTGRKFWVKKQDLLDAISTPKKLKS